MSNKICIYAICKNEIKYVQQWLDSMAEADYIVVLDTGSTDGTYELLQNDPRVTKVEQKEIKPWRFDIARNESLKLVPEDANILFCTDFDELLEPGWGDLIRSSWNENIWRGHYTYVWSHTNTGTPGVTFWYDKMHIKGYYWKYAVHEVLMPPNGEEQLKEEQTDGHLIDFGRSIILHHYPDQEKSRSNYLDLLKLRVDEDENDVYGLYLLGREYGNLGEIDLAINYFTKCLNHPRVKHYTMVRNCVLGYMGDLYIIKNDLAKSIYYYNQQIILDNTYREPYLNLAEIYNKLGLYRLGLSYVETALEKGVQHYDWTERPEHWAEKPYDLMSVSYYYLNEIDKGIENAIRALQLNPSNDRIQKNYLALLNKRSSNSQKGG